MSGPVDVLAVRHPWDLTREQWNAERERVRPCVAQSNFTRASASEAVAMHDRLTWLLGGVNDAARAELEQATRGDVVLSPERVEALLETIQRRATYDDVMAHGAALARVGGAA